MLIDDFNRTLDIWIRALEDYNMEQLVTRPNTQDWSLGQVYIHLIDDTQFYLEQIELCLTTNDNASGQASRHVVSMLNNNAFPDMRIKGAADHPNIPQPDNKEQLMHDLLHLKNRINLLAAEIVDTPFKGKAEHPGFKYLSAQEWMQLAEMHFRHHLRQKARIDAALAAPDNG